ncbi:glycoside hydrolase family 1 protein [Actinomyces minihominis]|uniref:glycoside hydrolase family 1 protein n=1 Tax=Actinomyces minihominis TaxID=2002838 RepID=UPI000C06F997|nr:family 1 glycosylhydrolase [Actinomyces minihominis]
MKTGLLSALNDARLETPRPIPRDFLLGAATAAYQIEGAASEGGRGPSIWDTFSHTPGTVVNGDTGDVACDHYHRYRDDVALMRRLGLDSYRFSVSWARVNPDGKTLNREGVDFYSRLVDELLASHIKPWLTLYHWDLPQALEDRGGWTNRDTSMRFRDYAMQVHERLGDRVGVWTTLNEPWCSSFLSYTGGEHAPGHRSLREGMLASHHLLLGHGLAVQALGEADDKLNLGLTVNLTPAQPLDPESEADRRAARLVDGQANRWFLDPLFKGHYPADTVEEYRELEPESVTAFEAAVRPGDLEVISTPIQTLGVNYYQGEIVTGSRQLSPQLREKIGFDVLELPPVAVPATTWPTSSPMRASRGFFGPDTYLPRSDMQWEIDPVLLKHLLLRVSRDYTAEANTALYVTETGTAMPDRITETADGPVVHDPEREAYLELHLAATLDARDEGADVRGFFYWSLMDNFEWAWGYDKRFGLIYVDYPTQRRIPKDSALTYSRIIKSRELNVARDAGLLVRRGTIVENVPYPASQ